MGKVRPKNNRKNGHAMNLSTNSENFRQKKGPKRLKSADRNLRSKKSNVKSQTTLKHAGFHSSVDENIKLKRERLKRREKKQCKTISSNENLNEIAPRSCSLIEKMSEKLRGARFRYINECLYTRTGSEAKQMFAENPEIFNIYHEGYEFQKGTWPVDPLDVLIQQLNKITKKIVIADMGCGNARLAESVSQHKVYSFDLSAANDRVTACDMAQVPLEDGSVDICVYCLSLMGTNLSDYFIEANRILKTKGLLKVVEISSRFKSIRSFRRDLEKLGFQFVQKGSIGSDDYFLQLDFEKVAKPKKKFLPGLILNPCQYKKR